VIYIYIGKNEESITDHHTLLHKYLEQEKVHRHAKVNNYLCKVLGEENMELERRYLILLRFDLLGMNNLKRMLKKIRSYQIGSLVKVDTKEIEGYK